MKDVVVRWMEVSIPWRQEVNGWQQPLVDVEEFGVLGNWDVTNLFLVCFLCSNTYFQTVDPGRMSSRREEDLGRPS